MITDFTEAMLQRSDKQLAEILTIKRNDYQATAVEAAELEFRKRGLEISTFVTGEDIKRHEELNQPIDPSKENLHWYFKIGTLALPISVATICQGILSTHTPIIFFYLPISIGLQMLIHYTLQQKGFDKIATDFKNWSYYSWTIPILFFILGYVIGMVGRM
jgi:hypothetical protein